MRIMVYGDPESNDSNYLLFKIVSMKSERSSVER